MDESLQQLEAELKALKPRRPSARLIAQVELDLEVAPARVHYTSATNLSSWKWFGWRTVAAAAAVAFVAALAVYTFKPAPPAAGPDRQMAVTPAPAPVDTASPAPVTRERYQPVAATNVLYDLKDEGLVRVNGDTAAHQLRYRYLDTYTLRNPRGNASLTWSVPRDEIRVIPATFN